MDRNRKLEGYLAWDSPVWWTGYECEKCGQPAGTSLRAELCARHTAEVESKLRPLGEVAA